MEIVYENSLIPYPLKALRKDLRKKHSPMRAIVDKLINDYVGSNGTGFLKMSDLFIKLMEDDINLYEFTEADWDELNTEMEKLDSKFKHVNEFIKEMSLVEKTQLWIDKYEDSLKSLRKTRDLVLKHLITKELWEPVDTLFFSYCFLMISVIQHSIEDLKQLSPHETVDKVRFIDSFTVIYGSVILAYFRGKLREEVLRARLSEIATFSSPGFLRMNKRIQTALDKTDTVMPCPR